MTTFCQQSLPPARDAPPLHPLRDRDARPACPRDPEAERGDFEVPAGYIYFFLLWRRRQTSPPASLPTIMASLGLLPARWRHGVNTGASGRLPGPASPFLLGPLLGREPGALGMACKSFKLKF